MSSAIQRFATPFPVPLSKAVQVGGFLFVSGVLPMNAQAQILAGDITAQTRAVLERIAQTLAECGARMEQVVRVTVWLADLADFDAFNQEYAQHFDGALPARSCVQAVLYQGAKVEIEVQAWVGSAP